MPSLRLIVLNYERPANVNQILNVYKDLCPITVINNNPDEGFPYLGQPIEVINNEKNWLCMERWHRCFEYDEEFKLVVDDDLLPHPSLVKSMVSRDDIITGVYGKSGVLKSSNYGELTDHWCMDSKVDFLVGSVILVKQNYLNGIQKDIEKIGYPERGDDIFVSYLLRQKYNLPSLNTVSGKVLNLPSNGIGLNKNPEHYSMRWNMVEKFKNISWTADESVVK